MTERRYYSLRTGRNDGALRLDLPTLKRLFRSLYAELQDEGWFQDAFGFECVDAGQIAGRLGRDVEGAVLLALRKDTLWPIHERLDAYSEDDLFDVIEFLHDHVAEPKERTYHDWSGCGWHVKASDPAAGRAAFRARINAFLRDYGDGFELSPAGEVLTRPRDGMAPLLDAPLPATTDETNVRARVDAATTKFRRHSASSDDRREALRALADVLEFLRPQVKEVLASADEGDLFNLANNFGIRHHNARQKTAYDGAIWHSWMFYYYLATIHASLRLLERKQQKSTA